MAGQTSEIVYLCIYNCHNGECVRIPKPVRFHQLAEFKQYLVGTFGMDSVDNIYLLTSFGIKLNFGVVNELSEVYCFDKRLFSNSPDKGLIEDYTTVKESVFKPASFHLPENSSNVRDITNNLKANSGWSNSITQTCHLMDKKTKELVRQINVIFKSLTIIFQFGTNFINEFEKTFNNYHNYINMLSLKSLHQTWQTQYDNLKRFPEITVGDGAVRLTDFLDRQALSGAADYVKSNLPEIVNRFNVMGSSFNDVNEEKLNIDRMIEEMRNDSIHEFKDVNAQSIMQGIETNNGKMFSDIDAISNNSSMNMKSLYQDHINYSKKVYGSALELYSYFKSLIQFKTRLTKETLSIFSGIANLQLKVVTMKGELKTLTSPSKTNNVLSYNTISMIKKCEDHLSLTIDMPLIFGFLLIEKRRQFEWYDFFSKGIVHNVSEQLMGIIEQEKMFRRLWVRKFGSFLTIISKDADFGTLPNIDVTLFNNKPEMFLSKLSFEIERKDITSYIQLVSEFQNKPSFTELLDKNYKDLIQSTNNMKRITKSVSDLTVASSGGNVTKLSSSGNQDRHIEEVEYDADLVKGLKSRIKKLEHLLHQQQYKNLSSWPVTKGSMNGSNVSNSLMIDQTGQQVSSKPKNDPTSLLQRRSTLPVKFQNPANEESFSTVLDTAPIDKHLENIRLKKENSTMLKQQEIMNSEFGRKDEEIRKLKKSLEISKADNKKLKEDLEISEKEKSEQISSIKFNSKIDTKELDNLKKKIVRRDETANRLESEFIDVKEANQSLKKELEATSSTINELKNELMDAKSMKNDLLSNMSSKEIEYIRERNRFEGEIRNLTARLEEVTDDYENLMEITESGHKDNESTINELNNVIGALLVNIQKLSHIIYDYFVECCLILESMGLLLVSENGYLKISRVKGLRSKKSDERDNDSSKPITEVVDKFKKSISWIKNLDISDDIIKSVSSDENETSKITENAATLIGIYNDWFKEDNSPFSNFVAFSKLENNVPLVKDEKEDQRVFLSAISKRFNDVEGYAKKQTKESKSKVSEMNKMRNKLNSKISVNNFQTNDLVLFLPTKIEKVESEGEFEQPWAAFNIGAPHYFLKCDNTDELAAKDWMVGRVIDVEEHTVTAENVDNKQLNPFQLSEGIIWYMLDASEESI